MAANENSDIVYILLNDAMPSLVKIGVTGDLEERLRQLSSSTSVPLPFRCYYAARVKDSKLAYDLEKRFQAIFKDERVHQKREFFRLDPLKPKLFLETHQIEDVTPRGDIVSNASKDLNEADIESIKVAETQKAKVFTFALADVPIGAKIEFVKDSQITATVVEEKKVILDESPSDGSYFLSPLTLKILEEKFGVKYISVQGSQYWVYEAETLQARRERIEERLNASEQ